MKTLNFVVRFVLELCAVAALGYWGFVTGAVLAARLLLGLGAPLLAISVWGAFVAPRARWLAKEPWRLLVEMIVFGAAAAGLATVGQPILALALAVIYAINRFILVRLGAMDNF